jgi:hypothetical protein
MGAVRADREVEMKKLNDTGRWMAIKVTYAGGILLGLIAVLDVFGIVLARPGAILPFVLAAGAAALLLVPARQ